MWRETSPLHAKCRKCNHVRKNHNVVTDNKRICYWCGCEKFIEPNPKTNGAEISTMAVR